LTLLRLPLLGLSLTLLWSRLALLARSLPRGLIALLGLATLLGLTLLALITLA
jgi:hypothetical protein